MHEGDGNRSLSNCGCHALDIAGADVAHSEYSRQTGFEEVRGAGERPMHRCEIVLRKIRTRLDEAVGVEDDTAFEPRRIGRRACHDENMTDVVCFQVSGFIIPPSDTLQMIGAFEPYDFRVSQ